MRVVTKESLISRNKTIAQALFFVSMAVLVGSFFFGTSAENSQLASTLQCVVLPVLLLMVISSVRMTNTWVRQPHPWDAIPAGLKGVGGDTVMYNFLLPANHVLIGPAGIFAITTRFQDKPQVVKDGKWQGQMGLFTLMRQEQIGNPTQEALLKANQTEAYLRELLQDEAIEVQPLIVFVHPRAKVEVEGEVSVPVLYSSPDKKKQSLKTFLREAEKKDYPTLTDEQLKELDDLLLYDD